jgi:hypothetical protein
LFPFDPPIPIALMPFACPALVGAILLTLSAGRAAAAQSAAAPTRFHDPDHITGDPTGLRPDSTVHAWPRYPDKAREEFRTAAPVIAFVVDTLGRVELESASFLDEPAPEFRGAVCDLLPKLRFNPLAIEGQKMRVLLVQFYAFTTWKTPDSTGVAKARTLVQQRQEEFATQPIANTVGELERRPHCN